MTTRRSEGWAYRRKGIWYIAFYVDGKKFRESTGSTKPPKETFTNEDGRLVEVPPVEVKKMLRDRMNALDDGTWKHPSKVLKFDDLLQLVRDDWRTRGRKSSLTAKGGKEQAGVKRLREAFGRGEARSITASRLAAYANDRIDAGAAISTVRNDLNILKHGMTLAVKDDLLPKRPRFPTLVPKNIRRGFFKRGDFEVLRAALPEYLRGATTLMFWSGWRSKSEVFTRQWHHVDEARGVIALEKFETKNGEGREFPYGQIPELVDAIAWQRRYTDEVQRRLGEIVPFVFHREGKPFNRHTYRAWKKACKAVGLEGRRFHDFRRTAIRNLVQAANVPEKIAMEISGHLTRSVLDRYNITDAEGRTAAVAKLAKVDLSNEGSDRVQQLVGPLRGTVAVGE